MPKTYAPLDKSWAGICQAAQDFDIELQELALTCQHAAAENANLLHILSSLHNLLSTSIKLYEDYTNYLRQKENSRTPPSLFLDYSFADILDTIVDHDTQFALQHSSNISTIAWGLINLKPDDPHNQKDVEFANIYIDFLQRLKTLPETPKIPSTLRLILRATPLSELSAENDHNLFLKICDKGIETQNTRIARYEHKKHSTELNQHCQGTNSVAGCSAYQQNIALTTKADDGTRNTNLNNNTNLFKAISTQIKS